MGIQHIKPVKRTAILIDGGFYRAVAYGIFGEKTPAERADELEHYCKSHLRDKHEERELYRIFYYDCLPSTKIVYHPMLKKQVNLSKSPLNLCFSAKAPDLRRVLFCFIQRQKTSNCQARWAFLDSSSCLPDFKNRQ